VSLPLEVTWRASLPSMLASIRLPSPLKLPICDWLPST
jgi:hypothetical protein